LRVLAQEAEEESVDELDVANALFYGAACAGLHGFGEEHLIRFMHTTTEALLKHRSVS
jgi:hypothetical protein